MQEMYINLDDSGKLTTKERVCVYGGLVFFSKHDKDRFITQYRSIISEIKCKYCVQDKESGCNNECPEIKNTNIKNKHKRRLMNYMKQFYIAALVIKNDNVYSHIINNKAAKGRFIDYALRRLIKELVKNAIRNKSIDPYKPLRLIINIDQQTTKSNGYYSLHDGLMEELRYGISNFNYSTTFSPIFHSDLIIALSYQDSTQSYVVQAADLMAGTIRRKAIDAIKNGNGLHDELHSFVQYLLILP